MNPLILTQGLTRILPVEPPVTLVRNVDLEIRRGRFHAVIGPSGCGKSSLLYLLGLLDRPTSGRLEYDGVDTNPLGGDERAELRLQQFGFVFQFHFLLPEFSAIENVLMPIRRLGRLDSDSMNEKALLLLDSLDLAGQAQKTPDKMSGGERQRVAIARALAGRPRLLLADEPTGQLDSETAKQIMRLLSAVVQSEGVTALVATHDPNLMSLADSVLILEDGQITA